MDTHTILVPVDFSDISRATLREADEIAIARDASLTLLHVHPVVQAVFLDMTYTESPERLASTLAELEKTLEGWAAALDTPRERVTVKVVTGRPVDRIVEESAKHDLLVIATHGRSGVRHFLMGSVTEQVVRVARSHVLVVKLPGTQPD